MNIGEEEYYCIASLENIEKESVRSFIRKFDSFEEAVLFPNASFFVIKEMLSSENARGSSFI